MVHKVLSSSLWQQLFALSLYNTKSIFASLEVRPNMNLQAPEYVIKRGVLVARVCGKKVEYVVIFSIFYCILYLVTLLRGSLIFVCNKNIYSSAHEYSIKN
jgi:hypothetical protein